MKGRLALAIHGTGALSQLDTPAKCRSTKKLEGSTKCRDEEVLWRGVYSSERKAGGGRGEDSSPRATGQIRAR